MEENPLLTDLGALLGDDYVLTDDESVTYFSSDLYFTGERPVGVVAPGTFEELVETIRLCTGSSVAVLPRGGGLSYTAGYINREPKVRAVVLDTRRLNRITDLNLENMTITAECGCTWEQIMNAASKHGLRVPMFGPSTGRYSTIGGSLSNNCMFFGSAKWGTAADVVLGLEVVTAEGSVIPTGSGAIENGIPFFRNHGPDLTGLFLNDAGSLGIKARATLKLESIPAGTAYGTYSFLDFPSLIEAIKAVGRSGLASDCLGVGPINGDGTGPSLHVVTEGLNQDIAATQIDTISALVKDKGDQLDPAVPTFIRKNLFTFIQSPFDENGRLQIWTHGVFPYDRTKAAYDAFKKVLSDHGEEMADAGISATISFACAANAMMVEPVLYWTARPTPLHVTGMADLSQSQSVADNETATSLVRTIRTKFLNCMEPLGAAHMQYGRMYPYTSVTDDHTVVLLNGLKRILDPKRLINPGALNL